MAHSASITWAITMHEACQIRGLVAAAIVMLLCKTLQFPPVLSMPDNCYYALMHILRISYNIGRRRQHCTRRQNDGVGKAPR